MSYNKFNPNYNSDEYIDQGVGQGTRHILSKFDYDLFDEEKDTVEKVIRIKRICLPNKEERWKIYQDNKIVFIVEGIKLLKKEREFLRTADGINFLIGMTKNKIKSFHALHLQIKKILKKKK